MADVTNILTSLQKKIASDSDASNAMQLTTYAKSIDLLKVGAVNTIFEYQISDAKVNAAEGELFVDRINGEFLYKDSAGLTALGKNVDAVYTFGDAGAGELGDNQTATDRSSPSRITSSSLNWIDIAAGESYALAIDEDGTGYGWGSSGSGRNGTGTSFTDRSSPTTIVTSLKFTKVSAGRNASFAIGTNGFWYSWGEGGDAVTATGTTTDYNTPVLVDNGRTWKDISAGYDHGLAVTSAGQLGTTGRNGYGQNAANTVNLRENYITLPITLRSVSAGQYFSLAVDSDGVGYSWGRNNLGQLGNNDTLNRSSPTTIVGGITWNQLSAGYTHSVGISDSGILYSWGNAANGKLGDNTVVNKSSPITVLGGITNWASVNAQINHTVAITDSDIGYAWGLNSNGQLGDGTTIAKSSPVSIISAAANGWKTLKAGNDFTVGLSAIPKRYT